MSILCRLFGHSVETTHTNRYQVPTREVCTRCMLSRSLERNSETGLFYWEYNNGMLSSECEIFDESDIKFGRYE